MQIQKSPSLGKIPKPPPQNPDSHLDHLVMILSLINGIWSSADDFQSPNGQKETTYVSSLPFTSTNVLPTTTGHFHTKHRTSIISDVIDLWGRGLFEKVTLLHKST